MEDELHFTLIYLYKKNFYFFLWGGGSFLAICKKRTPQTMIFHTFPYISHPELQK